MHVLDWILSRTLPELLLFASIIFWLITYQKRKPRLALLQKTKRWEELLNQHICKIDGLEETAPSWQPISSFSYKAEVYFTSIPVIMAKGSIHGSFSLREVLSVLRQPLAQKTWMREFAVTSLVENETPFRLKQTFDFKGSNHLCFDVLNAMIMSGNTAYWLLSTPPMEYPEGKSNHFGCFAMKLTQDSDVMNAVFTYESGIQEDLDQAFKDRLLKRLSRCILEVEKYIDSYGPLPFVICRKDFYKDLDIMDTFDPESVTYTLDIVPKKILEYPVLEIALPRMQYPNDVTIMMDRFLEYQLVKVTDKGEYHNEVSTATSHVLVIHWGPRVDKFDSLRIVIRPEFKNNEEHLSDTIQKKDEPMNDAWDQAVDAVADRILSAQRMFKSWYQKSE